MGNICSPVTNENSDESSNKTTNTDTLVRDQTEEDFSKISSKPIDIVTDINSSSVLTVMQTQKRVGVQDFNYFKVLSF